MQVIDNIDWKSILKNTHYLLLSLGFKLEIWAFNLTQYDCSFLNGCHYHTSPPPQFKILSKMVNRILTPIFKSPPNKIIEIFLKKNYSGRSKFYQNGLDNHIPKLRRNTYLNWEPEDQSLHQSHVL